MDAGAEILTVASAFTMTTGRDHWTPLLRARAIENRVPVIRAANTGQILAVDAMTAGEAPLPDGPLIVVARHLTPSDAAVLACVAGLGRPDPTCALTRACCDQDFTNQVCPAAADEPPSPPGG